MFKKLTLALALLCAHNASYSLTSQEENEMYKNKVVAEKYDTLGFACFSAGIIFAQLCKDFNLFYAGTAGTSALFGMSVLCGYYSLQTKRKNEPLRQKKKQEAERAREDSLRVQKWEAEQKERDRRNFQGPRYEFQRYSGYSQVPRYEFQRYSGRVYID